MKKVKYLHHGIPETRTIKITLFTLTFLHYPQAHHLISQLTPSVACYSTLHKPRSYFYLKLNCSLKIVSLTRSHYSIAKPLLNPPVDTIIPAERSTQAAERREKYDTKDLHVE